MSDAQIERRGTTAIKLSVLTALALTVALFLALGIRVASATQPAGTFLLKWGSVGSGDAEFDNPSDVAVDASGNVYVADGVNGRIQKFTSAGVFLDK